MATGSVLASELEQPLKASNAQAAKGSQESLSSNKPLPKTNSNDSLSPNSRFERRLHDLEREIERQKVIAENLTGTESTKIYLKPVTDHPPEIRISLEKIITRLNHRWEQQKNLRAKSPAIPLEAGPFIAQSSLDGSVIPPLKYHHFEPISFSMIRWLSFEGRSPKKEVISEDQPLIDDNYPILGKNSPILHYIQEDGWEIASLKEPPKGRLLVLQDVFDGLKSLLHRPKGHATPGDRRLARYDHGPDKSTHIEFKPLSESENSDPITTHVESKTATNNEKTSPTTEAPVVATSNNNSKTSTANEKIPPTTEAPVVATSNTETKRVKDSYFENIKKWINPVPVKQSETEDPFNTIGSTTNTDTSTFPQIDFPPVLKLPPPELTLAYANPLRQWVNPGFGTLDKNFMAQARARAFDRETVSNAPITFPEWEEDGAPVRLNLPDPREIEWKKLYQWEGRSMDIDKKLTEEDDSLSSKVIGVKELKEDLQKDEKVIDPKQRIGGQGRTLKKRNDLWHKQIGDDSDWILDVKLWNEIVPEDQQIHDNSNEKRKSPQKDESP